MGAWERRERLITAGLVWAHSYDTYIVFCDASNNGDFFDDRTRYSLQLGKYEPIPLVLILSSVMLLITESLFTRGQLPIHGREVRDSLQLDKYGPIPMVPTLCSMTLLITDILATLGQLLGHGREREIHYSWVSMGPFLWFSY